MGVRQRGYTSRCIRRPPDKAEGTFNSPSFQSEDGPIDAKYPLKEAPSASYLQRTEWNVRDSDATVLFSILPALSGGSKRTVEFALEHKKPWLRLCTRDKSVAEKLKAFIEEHRVKILNVAGPRASKEAGVGEFVANTVQVVFG